MIVNGACRGHKVVPVETLNGELVGYLCTECDEALPANYACDDCQWVDVTTLADDASHYVVSRKCYQHAGV